MLFRQPGLPPLTSSSNQNTPSETETPKQGQGSGAPYKHYQEVLTCLDFPKALVFGLHLRKTKKQESKIKLKPDRLKGWPD